MNSIITLTVLLALGCLVREQESCVPVGGGYGICISIFNCDSMLAILKKKDMTLQDIDFLQRSHCGFEGTVPTVCCSQAQPVTPAPANQCFTPDGKPGECISIYECPNLANLLKPPVANEKIQYVQRSRCQGSEQYSVCCGPVPSFQQTKPGNCAATVTAFPPDPKTKCCGLDAIVGNRIIGGETATIDQYPWLVIIEYVKDGTVKTLCGGALISGKYVLTAAHCVVGPVLNIGRPSNVRLGEFDTSNEGPDCAAAEAGGEDCTDGALRIPIERTIPHPQYNPQTVQKQNDIALIRLRQLAPFTEFIRPICLPTVDMTRRTDSFLMAAAGWGAVGTKQSSSPIKLHVELPFVPKDKCQPAYAVPGRNVSLWHGQFCAGGQKGKDSCKGDSGGPLMYENGKIYEAIGVVSFGPLPCGLENIPGVYTNVFEYDTWIRSNIAP